MLKIGQAEQAIKDGTEIINWTFDPLLAQNLLPVGSDGGSRPKYDDADSMRL